MSTEGHILDSRLPLNAFGRLFLATLERISAGHLQLQLPSGEQMLFGDAREEPSARLVLKDWRACRRILAHGDIGFAEALRDGWVDSPDLASLIRLAIRNQAQLDSAIRGSVLARAWHWLRLLLDRNTRRGSRRNIEAHYDLGNDFYGQWLDESWSYSSALFDGNFQVSLEAAQARKYQRVIDRLALKAGMRVLEIGCGWGGFAEVAASQGISVHGITLSPSQLRFARDRIRARELEHLVTLELRDYRDLTGQYDAVVSIEMFEAVGEAFWPGWFRLLAKVLRPQARAMVQTITIGEAEFDAYRSSSDFIRAFIFPGGMLPSPERFRSAALNAGLAVQSQFSFGKDYAETLRRWRGAFEHKLGAIRALGFDEAFVRVWRLYLTYCEAGFDEGRTDVMHFELARR